MQCQRPTVSAIRYAYVYVHTRIFTLALHLSTYNTYIYVLYIVYMNVYMCVCLNMAREAANHALTRCDGTALPKAFHPIDTIAAAIAGTGV